MTKAVVRRNPRDSSGPTELEPDGGAGEEGEDEEEEDAVGFLHGDFKCSLELAVVDRGWRGRISRRPRRSGVNHHIASVDCGHV